MKISYVIMLIVTLITFACKKPTEPISTDRIVKNKIVFVSDRETTPYSKQIYLMNEDGSNPVRITHDSNDYRYPCFSPDGSKILFYSHTYNNLDEIYIINFDCSGFINLTNSPGDDNLPSFSPDGAKIVFTSTRDGNREIYTMDSDGKNQTRLTFNDRIDHSPQFIEESSKILYFSSNPDNNDYNIHVMDFDGNNNKCLTEEISYYCHRAFISDGSFSIYDSKPCISPDGLQIIFMSYNYNQGNYEIFMIESDGKNPRILTSVPGYNIAPVFSPDGSKIIFRSHRGANFDIYEMDLNGQQQINLTVGGGHAYFADFSQDGTKILFNTDREPFYKYKIWKMNFDGSEQTQLTFGDYNDYYPRFQLIP